MLIDNLKKQEAEVNEKNAKSLEKLMKSGATFESACKILGLDLKENTKKD